MSTNRYLGPALLLLLALAGGASVAVAAPASDVTVERFQCFTKAREDLATPAGGPAGSHWNPGDVRCEVTLAWATGAEGATLDLHYGQGRRLPLVARRHVAPKDPIAPYRTAPEGARGVEHAFFVPQRVIETGAKRTKKDEDSGADLYHVRFELVVTPLGAGPAPKPIRRTIRTTFSFGE